MFLNEFQRLLLRKDGETSQQHYERVDKARLAVVIEQSRPRCINCKNFSGQKCLHFDQSVEDEYVFAANDCPKFDNDELPF